VACLRPVWASEVSSWTPVGPLALRDRRNAVQKAPSSLSPTSQHFATTSVVTPVAITTARDTTRLATRALDIGGVQEHIREAGVAERVASGGNA
jgi:hypothetical protein